MKQKQKGRHLVLVYGGGTVEGPVERLGLAERVEPVSRRHVAVMIVAKLVLLGGVLYYLYG